MCPLQSGPVLRDGPPTGPGDGVKLCSGAWKYGPQSPVGVISLCSDRTPCFLSLNSPMVLKRCIEEVLYCFSRSSVKFHGHTGQKIANFDPNWAFPNCNYSWIHWWFWNDAQSLKRCLIGFQGHQSNFKVTQGEKLTNCLLIWVFPNANSNLNSRMAMKWHT